MKISRTKKITTDDIGKKVEIIGSRWLYNGHINVATEMGATKFIQNNKVYPQPGNIGVLKNLTPYPDFALVEHGDYEYVFSTKGLEVIGKGRLKEIW